jgi:hypothetical protein
MTIDVNVQYVKTPPGGPGTGPPRPLVDGLSWETARETVHEAYDALPQHGGTIYLAERSWIGLNTDDSLLLWGNVVRPVLYPDERGLQQVAIDPLPGWRRQKGVRFVGVGGALTTTAQLPGPAIYVVGGSPEDPLRPVVWAAATNAPLRFENISFGVGSGAWTPVRFGCGPKFVQLGPEPVLTPVTLPPGADALTRWREGVDRRDDTNWMTFVNCGFVPNPVGGPSVDIGFGYFAWFERCSFSAPALVKFIPQQRDREDPRDTELRDRRCAVLVKPGPGEPAFWRLNFYDCFANHGGIRFHAAGGPGGMTVRKFHVEDSTGQIQANPRHPVREEVVQPGVHIVPPPDTRALAQDGAQFFFEEVQVSPESPHHAHVEPAVLIDGISPAGSFVCVNTHPVVGPATILSQFDGGVQAQRRSPASHGQTGFFRGRVVAQHDSARRAFGPVAVRFPNLFRADLSQWAECQGTLNGPLPAPDGSRGAFRLDALENGVESWVADIVHVPLKVGDWFAFGVWVRAPLQPDGSSYGVPNEVASLQWEGLFFDGPNGMFPAGVPKLGPPQRGDGEWGWVSMAARVLLVPPPPSPAPPVITYPLKLVLKAVLPGPHGGPVELFGPVVVHMPQGTVSDNEAIEIGQHLASFPRGAPVGAAALLEHQDLALHGRVIGQGEPPDPQLVAAAGSGASVEIRGSAIGGVLMLTAGASGLAAGHVLRLRPASRDGRNPTLGNGAHVRMVLTAADDAAAANAPRFYVRSDAPGKAYADLWCGAPMQPHVTYSFHYHAFFDDGTTTKRATLP